jgi:hypothetical protein
VINKTHRWIISVYGVCLLVLMLNIQFQASENTALIERKIGRYRILRLHYNNSSDEKGVTTFEYNQEGLMYKALWQLLDGSRNSINFYTHDHNGNLIRKYREFSDGKTSTQLFKYDENGNLIFEDFNRSDGIKGETSYVYDTRGILLEADCRGLNGWFFGVIKYRYDERRRKKEAEIERDGQKIGKIEYRYDENNYLSEEYWDLSGEWNQTFSYEYEECLDNKSNPYTSSNIFLTFSASNKVIKEDYDFNKKSGGPSYYEYDESGKLTRKTFKRSDGLKTVTDYFYDVDNRLVKSLRRYTDGGSGIFSYEYNENRNLIKRTFIHVDGSTAEELYQYDGTGRLIRAVWDKFDTWLTGTITFDYDRSGDPLIGHFKGSGDNKFDADITFSFDENKNLIRIHWKFSFDGTQTYTFGYEKRAKSDYFPQLKGEYLGRKLPGNIPEIFERQIPPGVQLKGIPFNRKRCLPSSDSGRRVFFFGSTRKGKFKTYWMDANILEVLRPKEIKQMEDHLNPHHLNKSTVDKILPDPFSGIFRLLR